MGRDERGQGAVILKTVDAQPSGGSNPIAHGKDCS